MEVLAARYRCGEHLWTFDSRHKKTIRELASMGMVNEMSGVVEHSVRASLTEAGKAIYLLDTYQTPRSIAEYERDVTNLINERNHLLKIRQDAENLGDEFFQRSKAFIPDSPGHVAWVCAAADLLTLTGRMMGFDD